MLELMRDLIRIYAVEFSFSLLKCQTPTYVRIRTYVRTYFAGGRYCDSFGGVLGASGTNLEDFLVVFGWRLCSIVYVRTCVRTYVVDAIVLFGNLTGAVLHQSGCICVCPFGCTSISCCVLSGYNV